MRRNIGRISILILFVVIVLNNRLHVNAATIIHAGTDGSYHWSIDSDGKLVVLGDGDYVSDSNTMPFWSAYSKEITSAVITIGGITDIFDLFSGCSNMRFADLSGLDMSSVYENEELFDDCISLESVRMPDKISYKVLLPNNRSGYVWKDEYGYECNHARVNYDQSVVYTLSDKTKLIDGYRFIVGDMCYEVENTSKKTCKCKGYEYNDIDRLKYYKLNMDEKVQFREKYYSITAIGDNAFKGRTKLTAVNIGKNVKTIGNSAFEECTALKSVTLGNNVTKLGKKAFYNCKSLKKIHFKTTKLKSVGAKAFKNINKNYKIKVKKKYAKKYMKLTKGKIG